MIIKSISGIDGEVSCLTLRHLPFGFREAALQAELYRRRQAHERRLSARRKHLAALQVAAAELTQYIALLREEADRLQARQEELLRRLASPDLEGQAGPPESDLDAADSSNEETARLQAQLHQYRALREQICNGVMALIAPFLTPDPARYPAPETTRGETHGRAAVTQNLPSEAHH